MTVPYTFQNAVTSIPLSQLDANFTALGNSTNMSYTASGAGAVTRTVESKLADFLNVKDYGATGDNLTDDTAAILAACTAAQNQGIQNVYFPAGTYRHTTLNLTDMSVRLIGDGVNSTTLKYVGTNTNDGIKFGTSQTATKKVYGCGLQQITIDANSLARRAVEITSIYGGYFESIQILNPYAYGMYWTCLNDRVYNSPSNDPSDNQRCYMNDVYVQCVNVTTATAIFLDGNNGTAAAEGANTSLNSFQNIRLNIRNGDGFVFGYADGNTLLGLWVFRTVSATGRGLVFSADNTGRNRYARENNCFNVQLSRSGIYALAGDGTQPSEYNYVFSSVGNGSVNYPPVVETGAKMSWQNEFMTASFAGYKSVFVDGGTAVQGASNAIAQIPLVGNESLRVYNRSNNHIILTNNNDDAIADKWGINIVDTSGDLRFVRSGASTGNIEALYVIKTTNVTRLVATYATNTVLTTSNGIVLVNATSANVQITLPLANAYGGSRSPAIQIRRIDASANTVTIIRQGTDTLNGGTSETLAASAGKTYVCDASSAWYSL